MLSIVEPNKVARSLGRHFVGFVSLCVFMANWLTYEKSLAPVLGVWSAPSPPLNSPFSILSTPIHLKPAEILEFFFHCVNRANACRGNQKLFMRILWKSTHCQHMYIHIKRSQNNTIWWVKQGRTSSVCFLFFFDLNLDFPHFWNTMQGAGHSRTDHGPLDLDITYFSEFRPV